MKSILFWCACQMSNIKSHSTCASSTISFSTRYVRIIRARATHVSLCLRHASADNRDSLPNSSCYCCRFESPAVSYCLISAFSGLTPPDSPAELACRCCATCKQYWKRRSTSTLNCRSRFAFLCAARLLITSAFLIGCPNLDLTTGGRRVR